MSLFTSGRERRLWLYTLVVLVAVYLSLGLAQTLAADVLNRRLVDSSFFIGLFLVLGAILMQGLKARPAGAEIGVAMGIAGVYFIVFLRMLTLEHRSHLIEYTIVALLIYEALTERKNQGRRVPVPAVLAMLVTGVIGVFDECIQLLLPGRVFDPIDMLFNFGSGVIAVCSSATLSWVRRWVGRRMGRRMPSG